MTNGVSDYEHAGWKQRQAESISAGVSWWLTLAQHTSLLDFGLRTFRFTNGLQERIKFVNRGPTVCCCADCGAKDWQHYGEFCLLLPIFPFVPATSVDLLRPLDPEGEGSVTLGKVNKYLPRQRTWRLASSAKSQYLESSRWRCLYICITFIPVYSLFWTTLKLLYFAENNC
jgi:hypothetical protein